MYFDFRPISFFRKYNVCYQRLRRTFKGMATLSKMNIPNTKEYYLKSTIEGSSLKTKGIRITHILLQLITL